MVREEKVETGIVRRTFADGTVKYSTRRRQDGGMVRFSAGTVDEVRAWRERQTTKSRPIDAGPRQSQRIDEELLNAVLGHLRHEKRLAESTIAGYRKTFKRMAKWARSNKWTTASVTHEQFEAFRDHMSTDRHGQPTTAQYTNAAKACLVLGRSLVELRFRTDNPGLHPWTGEALDAKPGRRSERTVRTRDQLEESTGSPVWIPDWAEVLELVSHVDGPLYQLWFKLLALTGLRPSEAVGLRWDRDINLTRKFIRVKEPIVQVNGRSHVWGVDACHTNAEALIKARRESGRAAGKTHHSIRNVMIIPQLEPVLVKLAEFRETGEEVQWVFPGRRTPRAKRSVFGSLPFSYEYAQVAKFRPAAVAVGMPGLRQYDLRHHYASVLIAAGQTFDQVAMEMGNSPAMVRATYAHMNVKELERRRRSISEALDAG